jgi:hypothetical protein
VIASEWLARLADAVRLNQAQRRWSGLIWPRFTIAEAR